MKRTKSVNNGTMDETVIDTSSSAAAVEAAAVAVAVVIEAAAAAAEEVKAEAVSMVTPISILPVPRRRRRCLPSFAFGVVWEYLTVKERLSSVDRTCVEWRNASVRGAKGC